MIFNIVYHTPDAVTATPEAADASSNSDGLSIEVQMAWGGSSTYNFQVQHGFFCVRIVDIKGFRYEWACLASPVLVLRFNAFGSYELITDGKFIVVWMQAAPELISLSPGGVDANRLP